MPVTNPRKPQNQHTLYGAYIIEASAEEICNIRESKSFSFDPDLYHMLLQLFSVSVKCPVYVCFKLSFESNYCGLSKVLELHCNRGINSVTLEWLSSKSVPVIRSSMTMDCRKTLDDRHLHLETVLYSRDAYNLVTSFDIDSEAVGIHLSFVYRFHNHQT